MSRMVLSGLALAMLMAAVATPSAAADEAVRPELLMQGSLQDAMSEDAAARRTKGRVKTNDIVFVKQADASSPK